MADEKPILICWDGTEYAVRAIEGAADVLGKRKAVVVTVVPLMSPSESLASTSSVVPGNAFEDLNAAEGHDAAERGAEIARKHGFDAESRSEVAGRTWEGIVGVADELDSPVIVVGSRGLNAFEEAITKSTSHQVAVHAGRPVLTVPPAHADDED